jgi:hypothetical protein
MVFLLDFWLVLSPGLSSFPVILKLEVPESKKQGKKKINK